MLPVNLFCNLLFNITEIIAAIAVLSIITGVDDRLRLGGLVSSKSKGNGHVYHISTSGVLSIVFE